MGCKALILTSVNCQYPSFTLTMWDVKDDERTTDICRDRKFYLNYVGCKGVNICIASAGVSLFYLNYVGCKVLFYFKVFGIYHVLP